MKISVTELRKMIKEATMGEEQFAELEAAREAFDKNRGTGRAMDGDALSNFLSLVEKLVEPVMIDIGPLFFEMEAFMNRGELVFNNNKVEVTIDPLGKKDTYEVDISPQYGAEDDIQPMKAAFPTMKGALQFVHDKIGDKEFSPERVGEPKGQGELPLENKMKVQGLRDLIKKQIQEIQKDRMSYLLNLNEEVLEEGVYDPGILKAVFTAGGPGSGKSYVADVMFDAREAGKDKMFDAASFIGRFGLKYVNSDNLFEIGLKKMGIPLADLGAISQAAKEGGEYKGEDAKEVAEKIGLLGKRGDSVRAIAKGKLAKLKDFYTAGRLGMLIDGTGKDFGKMAKKKQALDALGYDSYMIFVDTSLENALAQNAKRERKLDPEEVEKMWNRVQANKEDFQELFGVDNFTIVVNNEPVPPTREATRAVQRFVEAPVANPLGQNWINVQLAAKDTSGDAPSEEPSEEAPEEEKIFPLQIN